MESSTKRQLALEMTRQTLSIFKREWNIESEDGSFGVSLCESLISLQDHLRSSKAAIDPQLVIAPFISLVVSPILSGPYKLLALEALQAFVANDVLVGSDPAKTTDAVDEIALSVARCKFVQTDTGGDELVQLQVVNTLQSLFRGSTSSFLTNETVWGLVEALHSIAASTGAAAKISLHYAAEEAVMTAVRFVFQSGAAGGRTAAELPCCALKILGFYQSVLERAAAGLPVSLSSVVSGSKKYKKHSLLRLRSFTESKNEADVLVLLLAMRVLHVILLSSTADSMLWRSPELIDVLRGDVCNSLLLLCFCDYPVVVTHNVLYTFSLVYSKMGPVCRVVAECFMKRLYLNGMHQVLARLREAVENHVHIGSASPRPIRSSSSSADADDAESSFTLEQLQAIVDSLADILSEDGLLCTLFASFDCDLQKVDIMQPLVQCLSDCARLSLAYCPVEELNEIRRSCVVCFSQVLNTLTTRSVALNSMKLEKFPKEGKSVTTASPITSSGTSPACSEQPTGRGAVVGGEESAKATASSITAMLQAKEQMARAAELVSKSAREGWAYLQSVGMLENPPSAASVANFMRTTPSISVEFVGKFLGELGVGSEDEAFHREVLRSYVRSFEFGGKSLLGSIRIFLSAFLLPKEAQQIDRIFVAFSDNCHKSCAECVSGLLENADVTYIMTISIIMLNTDLHNDSIRADRKMTMEKFVKVNSNYGPDAKQTRDLPASYLEEIYKEISTNPIRTKKNEDFSSSTLLPKELIEDLLQQVRQYPERGFLTSPTFSHEAISVFAETFISGDTDAFQDLTSVRKASVLQGVRVNPMAVSRAICGKVHILDEAIVRCSWQRMMNVWLCAFAEWHDNVDVFAENARSQEWVLREGMSCLDSLILVVTNHKIPAVIDMIILILADFAAVTDGAATTKAAEICQLDCGEVFKSAPKEASAQAGRRRVFMQKLFRSLPARLALGKLLEIVQKFPGHVCDAWPVVWHTLGLLRACALIPDAHTGSQDLLPASAREEFNQRLSDAGGWDGAEASVRERRISSAASSTNTSPRDATKRRSSSIFGFIFGSGDSDNTLQASSVEPAAASISPSMDTYEVLQAEADTEDLLSMILQVARVGQRNKHAPGVMVFEGDVEEASSNLRKLLRFCDAANLPSSTRFYEERTLVRCFCALTSPVAGDPSDVGGGGSETEIPGCSEAELSCTRSIQKLVVSICKDLPAADSVATVWCERVIMEIVVRNRDRATCLLEPLHTHYTRRLSADAAFSYLTEQSIVCSVMIAERLLSRNMYTRAVIKLLGAVFLPQAQADDDKMPRVGVSAIVLREFAGHMSSGLWRILTTNVDALIGLTSTDWQVIFDIIGCSAGVGGYAGIKSFETLAWLLNEPCLETEVPIFCVSSIQPLLRSPNVPVAVNRGAVQLLMILHTRLEVLASAEAIARSASLEADDVESADVWETCWLPILTALAAGANHEQAEVRKCAASALLRCMRDKQALAVPAGVLLRVLQSIIAPTVLLLGSRLLRDATADASTAGTATVSLNDSKLHHPTLALSSPAQRAAEKTDVEEDSAALACLVALCEAFLQQTQKLAAYPAFDKIWLGLLHVLGFFLGAPHGIAPELLRDAQPSRSATQELQALVEAARRFLDQSMHAMQSAGLFETRPGLRQVTEATVQALPETGWVQ